MAVQNHIHLATTLGIAPELAPAFEWRITEREVEQIGFVTIETTQNGRTKFYVLQESSVPVKLENFVYKIVIDEEFGYTQQERWLQLKAMCYKVVYLVDTQHEDNGVNHTPSVKSMFMSQIGTPERIEPSLKREYVEVQLMDNSRP